MRLRRLVVLMAVVFQVTGSAMVFAGAQARVEGHVTDSQGNPIPGVEVTITSPQVSTFKMEIKGDQKGVFKFLLLDATRNYFFHVEAAGYQPQERPFKVAAGSTDTVFEFTLKTIQEAAAAGTISLMEQPGYKQMAEGRVLYEAGDKTAALAKFKEAVAAKPDLIQALAAVAELSYGAGDYQGAIEAAELCLEQDDESIDCLAIAANSAQNLGDEAAHAAYMARYKEANPEDPTVLYNTAAGFLNKLDDEGARPLLERCLAADPDFPQCNFEYGMLLLRTGDMEGAKKYLEKYLEVAPDEPDAATARETIKYL